MRVALFTDTIGDLNGVSRFIQDMSKQSLLHNRDLQILCSTRKYTPESANIHNHEPLLALPMPFYPELDLALAHRARLHKTAQMLKPDVVHVSTPGPVGMAGLAFAKKHNLPVVGTYHTDFPAYVLKNTGFETLKKVADRVMARFHKPFGHLLTRSDAYRSVIARDIRFPADKIHLLPAGTDIAAFHPSWRDEKVWAGIEGLRPGSLKALYVGRISAEKNVPFLLEAWQSYQEEYGRKDRPVDLILIGEGRLRKEADKWRKHHAFMIGPVVGKKLLRLYASADFFLFPSVTDTLGQVVMEAQSSGLPVVVTDRGGPQTLLNLGGEQTGIVAPAENLEAWVGAIRRLVDDAAFRKTLGEAAHRSMQLLPIERSFHAFWQTHCNL